MAYNNGVIQRRFLEGAKLTKTVATPSPLTDARVKAVAQIKSYVKPGGASLDTVITKVMTDPASIGAVRAYVRNHMETPFVNPVKLGVQAALIRFSDMATIAKALSISDAEALVEIENSEYEAIKNNAPDAGILPVDVQACLSLIINEMLRASKAAGLSADSPGLFNDIKVVTGDNYDNSITPLLSVKLNGANNADGDYEDYRPDGSSGTDYSTTSSSGDGSATNPVTADSGGGWSWDSIFGTINQAIGVVKNATSAVTGITGSVNTGISSIDSALNKVGSTAGASAINASSLPLIIGGGFLLVIIVIIIIYANKRK